MNGTERDIHFNSNSNQPTILGYCDYGGDVLYDIGNPIYGAFGCEYGSMPLDPLFPQINDHDLSSKKSKKVGEKAHQKDEPKEEPKEEPTTPTEHMEGDEVNNEGKNEKLEEEEKSECLMDNRKTYFKRRRKMWENSANPETEKVNAQTLKKEAVKGSRGQEGEEEEEEYSPSNRERIASQKGKRKKPSRPKPVQSAKKNKYCHQCHQPMARAQVASCQTYPCTLSFCIRCLKNRYGLSLQDCLSTAEWRCPKCSDICNCSSCRKSKGMCPTRQLFTEIKAKGYLSVHHYLMEHDGNVINYNKKSNNHNHYNNDDTESEENEEVPSPDYNSY